MKERILFKTKEMHKPDFCIRNIRLIWIWMKVKPYITVTENRIFGTYYEKYDEKDKSKVDIFNFDFNLHEIKDIRTRKDGALYPPLEIYHNGKTLNLTYDDVGNYKYHLNEKRTLKWNKPKLNAWNNLLDVFDYIIEKSSINNKKDLHKTIDIKRETLSEFPGYVLQRSTFINNWIALETSINSINSEKARQRSLNIDTAAEKIAKDIIDKL